ncbi:putative J domain-containing protein C63.03 [Colletotrichum chlorophyti]|uniref:Putative J domain-containing protein C63.03 n=1 Tax=Colletotrichum chlorophyti TaxID=708187 RepID=A0A1Q8RBM4_9PEZI|nr:putative J domain-containing protein C63.03 [Colletotrichum chlorophyti]
MADPPGHPASLRVRRTRGGTSRNSSARSSLAWEDCSYLHAANHQQGLRSPSSRFSLNEQFAATRREYEFGDDDASSVIERLTVASDLGDDSTTAVGMCIADAARDADGFEGDYYDLLCLPKDPTLTPDQIRKSYHRLLIYLHKDGLPGSLHPAAQPYLAQVQTGFETLIDPHRRALYDASQLRDLTHAREQPLDDDYIYAYDLSLKEQLRRRTVDVVQTSSDLGIRFDASKSLRRGSAMTPLDFTLSHSITVGLPVLSRLADGGVQPISQRAPSSAKRIPSISVNQVEEVNQLRESIVYLPPPQLTLTGSVYGVVEEIYRVPLSLLADRYQPLLPLNIPRKRITQLAEQRPCPLISLRLGQDIVRRTVEDRIAKTSIELECEVLPEPSLAARVSHPIHLPNNADPVLLEGSIRHSRPWTCAPPRVGIGISHRMGVGGVYALADSGDWSLWPGETIKFLRDFSQVSKSQLLAEFPMKTSASLEIGYTTSPERISFAGQEDSPRGECGIRGLDFEDSISGNGSWTVAASLTADAIAGYVRYGRDLLLGPSTARVEVELCSNTLLDRYMAVRSLWNIGRLSKLGFEFGVSIHSLHLSLYWSRLGQRLSIPVVLSPRADYTNSAFLYASAVPFLAFAVNHFLSKSRRTRFTEMDLQSYVARKRAAADELAAVLAEPVGAHQRAERQRGGLVILSAKFGVKEGGDWAAEEVADVTIAVAALVEDGRLRIPAGVRKGSLLGFWDPAPLRRKALHVRYLWRGRESTAEVTGRNELVLPPVKRHAS